MQIVVNGEPKSLEPAITLAELLVQFDLPPRRVAIELNELLVRRTEYERVALREGDRVEIVTLVGGG